MNTEDQLQWLQPIFFFLGLIFIANPVSDLTILLTVSIGVLGFSGIFLPLIVKNEVKEKSKKYIQRVWNESKEEFNEIINEMKFEFSKKNLSKIDYDIIVDRAEELSSLASQMESFKFDLEKTLKYSFFSSLLAVLFTLIEVGTVGIWRYKFDGATATWSPISLANVALIFGFYYLAKLVIIWFELSRAE